MSNPWYVESFKEDYLKIYAHRNDEAAQQEIAFIVDVLDMEKGTTVLDLCCGHGRHSRALAQRGFQVTGLDLSAVLLVEARRRQGELPPIRYIEGDVRELPFENEFDYVLNLFTSFGYFEEHDENMKVFTGIRRALKPGGRFLIDFLNPGHVKRTLQPYTERWVEELHIIEQRKIENNQVIKTIEVREGDEKRHYEERVQLFTVDEMKQMLKEAGLVVDALYGSLDGKEYDEKDAPRMVLIGRGMGVE